MLVVHLQLLTLRSMKREGKYWGILGDVKHLSNSQRLKEDSIP
jgi:hypothetical protein